MLIVLGGLLMTCCRPASAAIIDVTHPGVRSTGASILSLFQNLFGLALGPFIAGALSDSVGLETALAVTPLCGLIAVAAFLRAAGTYEADKSRAAEPIGGEAGGPSPNALASTSPLTERAP
jgi:MFS family permease